MTSARDSPLDVASMCILLGVFALYSEESILDTLEGATVVGCSSSGTSFLIALSCKRTSAKVGLLFGSTAQHFCNSL